MTDMTPEKRQMMQEMIEFAAKDQVTQLNWIKKFNDQRLAQQKQKAIEKDELA